MNPVPEARIPRGRRLFLVSTLAVILATLSYPTLTHAAITITRICSDTIHIESGSGNTATYVAYEITNGDAVDYDDIWVTLDNFTGGVVSPAMFEPGGHELGALASGESKPAYFYLQASTAPASGQSHDVNVRIGSAAGVPVATAAFAYSVEEAIASTLPAPTISVSMPGDPVVGTLVHVTVLGQSGALGGTGDFVAGGDGDPAWPADVFELVGATTRLWSLGDGCATMIAVVDGALVMTVAPDPLGYCYEIEYRFRARSSKPTTTVIAPRQYILSGGQAKFQEPNCALGACDIAPILPAYFHGTEVRALGDAGLTLDPGPMFKAGQGHAVTHGGTLMVGNIGSSGCDGVSMEPGASEGAFIGWQGSSMPPTVGSTIRFDVHTAMGIVPCVKLLHDPVSPRMKGDFSRGTGGTTRAEVWNDGVFVAELTGVSTDILTQDMPYGIAVDNELLPAVQLAAPFVPGGAAIGYWEADQNFTVDGAVVAFATGDELRLFPENPASEMLPVESVDMFISSGNGTIAVELTDLAQQMFGRLHRASEDVQLLSNLNVPPAPMMVAGATSRADHREIAFMLPPGAPASVQLDVRETETEECIIWDIKDGCHAGDSDDFSVVAELLTGGEGEVAHVSSLHDGIQWNVTPDFDGSGSPDVELQLYDASGNLVAEFASWTGTFQVQSANFATETGVLDYDRLALVLGYPTPVTVELNGAGMFSASRIVMNSNATVKHRFFKIVDRTVLSETGGPMVLNTELNAELDDYRGIPLEQATSGAAFIRKNHDHYVLSNIGSSGEDGVDLVPAELVMSSDLEWFYPGTPAAQMGETDLAFVTRHQGESVPTPQMSIRLVSDGSSVNVFVDPEQSSTPHYDITLKRGGVAQATFSHSSFSTAFAQLPDWPIGAGYRVLVYPDQPWKMYINLGQEMDVVTPGGPALRYGKGAVPLTKADLIEVIAQATPQPAPPVEVTLLSAKFRELIRMILKGKGGGSGGGGSGVSGSPVVSSLHPAYPNPFNPTTTLEFSLSRPSHVALSIYDVSGAFVTRVHDGALAAGPHRLQWDGTDQGGAPVASGVYFVELRTPDGRYRTKINLIK